MKVGICGTMNIECGISTYTEHLVEQYPENEVIIFSHRFGEFTDTQGCLKHPIIRCWSRNGGCDYKDLTKEIIKSGVTSVHFQHEFGIFQNNKAFFEMLKTLKSYDIGIIITCHTSFVDNKFNIPLLSCKDYVDIFIFHHEQFKQDFGLLEKSVAIPHASMLVEPKPKKEARDFLNIPQDKIVCLTMGFITSTKGAIDNISAILRLSDEFDDKLMLLIVGYPIVVNNNYGNLEYCLKLFKRVTAVDGFDKIKIIPKFIGEKELDWYAGAANIAIENYYETQNSTSGMSHLVMSYGLPSISSKSRILSDLDEPRSLKFDIGDVQDMTDKLRRLLIDEQLRKNMTEECLKYTKETSWPKIAKQTWEYYKIFHKG